MGGSKSHLQATVDLVPSLPWTPSQPMADHSFTSAKTDLSILTLGSSDNQNPVSDVTSQALQGKASKGFQGLFDVHKTAFIDPSVRFCAAYFTYLLTLF